MHTPASDDHDSRLYDSRRRRSNFGYFEPPVVDDTLSLALPPFARVHSRIVSMNGKTWILWFPNSILDAFYPGIRSPGYEVVMEKERTKRRFDGHLGRFDPTKSPQSGTYHLYDKTLAVACTVIYFLPSGFMI